MRAIFDLDQKGLRLCRSEKKGRPWGRPQAAVRTSAKRLTGLPAGPGVGSLGKRQGLHAKTFIEMFDLFEQAIQAGLQLHQFVLLHQAQRLWQHPARR